MAADPTDTATSIQTINRGGDPYMEKAVDLLRDLVLERQTELTDAFFVNRRTLPSPGRRAY
jgi:hypothetical protein